MKFSVLRCCLLAIPLIVLFVGDVQAGRRARRCCQPCAVSPAEAPLSAAQLPVPSQPPAVIPSAEKPPAAEPLPPVENRGPLVNPADLKPVR